MKDLGTFTKTRAAPPRDVINTILVIGYLLIGASCTLAVIGMNEASKIQTQGERV